MLFRAKILNELRNFPCWTRTESLPFALVVSTIFACYAFHVSKVVLTPISLFKLKTCYIYFAVSSNGPLCYSCSHQATDGSCKSVTKCKTSDVSFLMDTLLNGNHFCKSRVVSRLIKMSWLAQGDVFICVLQVKEGGGGGGVT